MDILNNKENLFKLVNGLSVEYFHKPFKHEVYFNHRLRTTGGRYIPSKKVIELNPKYEVELGRNELVGIIKHELCHYHLHIAGKGYQHGDAMFKQLLKWTGSPRHCQPLPSSVVKERHHVYQCSKCSHIYRRVRRVNVKKYRCGQCHGRLVKILS